MLQHRLECLVSMTLLHGHTHVARYINEYVRTPGGMGLHKSTFWLDVSTFCAIRWVTAGLQ